MRTFLDHRPPSLRRGRKKAGDTRRADCPGALQVTSRAGNILRDGYASMKALKSATCFLRAATCSSLSSTTLLIHALPFTV